MEFHTLSIPGLILITPRVFEDSRGHFMESYNEHAFTKAGLPTLFVQDNQSRSSKDVIRGLHFQGPPFAQGKLVRVVQGAAMDVAVDIRRHSPTYGKHYAVELNADNHLMLWIPEGFAHGFRSLQDNTILVYKCTAGYDAITEGSLRWDDPDLAIPWGIDEAKLSEKDRYAPSFRDFNTPFTYE